jgi:hypothetical protein
MSIDLFTTDRAFHKPKSMFVTFLGGGDDGEGDGGEGPMTGIGLSLETDDTGEGGSRSPSNARSTKGEEGGDDGDEGEASLGSTIGEDEEGRRRWQLSGIVIGGGRGEGIPTLKVTGTWSCLCFCLRLPPRRERLRGNW